MFWNTATTMVGSPCFTTSPVVIFGLPHGSKRRAGNPRGMAMVSCDWRLLMPFVASLVFAMDPSNVLEHCHNNGWLSLLHYKPSCHLWPPSWVKTAGRQSKRYGHGEL